MKTGTGEDGHNPLSVKVTDKVTQVLDYSPDRQNVLITNNSSVICYIGLSEGVTPDNGMPLAELDVFSIDKDNPYSGPLYAITSSGTADLRVMEVSRVSK